MQDDRAMTDERLTGGLRVLLLARYGMTGASSRVRHHAFAPPLAARGITLDTHHFVDDASLAQFYRGQSRNWVRIVRAYVERMRMAPNLRGYDLIWIEKEVLPRLPFWSERRFYGVPNVPTILDFDDYWIDRFENEGLKTGVAGETAKLAACLEAADVVTAANGMLADALAKIGGRRAQVVENCIDSGRFRTANARADAQPRPGPVRVGWIGTPYTAARFLPAAAAILNRMAAEGISQTVLIGAGAAVPELNAVRIEWDIDTEADSVAALDIGIMPLGTASFFQHKSCWKVYQYMAAGRPVVATRMAFSEVLIQDGLTGFLVDDPETFERRLRQLAGDAALRKRMGHAAQASIVTRFDIEQGADRLAALFYAAVAVKRANGSAAALQRALTA